MDGRTLILSAVFVALATAAFAGSNPDATFVLHARPGLDGTCTTGGQPDCAEVRPTVNVQPNSTCQVYFYLNNVSAVSGVQAAFAWDASWSLLGSSWNCQSNQLSATTPDPMTHGGSTSGTIATVFDCMTSPGLLLIGQMYFMTGATGCLTQVQSSYPFGNHVLDCALGIDEFNPGAAPERFGSVCVGAGGRDACDPPSGENLAPEADAGGVLYGGQTSAPIAFDGTDSTDPDGMIVAYAWDFGDGTTASGSMPTHVYEHPGEFQTILTVTDDRGATSSAGTEAVVVSQPATTDPALVAALAQAGENDLIPVIAVCDEQVPSATMYDITRGLSREDRRRTVLRALRSVVHTQDRALAYLSDQAQRGNATEPASIFIVNGLATKAKASVVSTLVSLQELDALYLDQRLVPMIDCLTQPDYSICQNTQNPCEGDGSTCADPPASCVKLGGEHIALPVAPSGDPAHPSVSYALQFLGMPEVWDQFRLKGTGSLILDMDAGIDYSRQLHKNLSDLVEIGGRHADCA